MQDGIEKHIEIAAPVERVWEVLTDHRQFGEWFGVNLAGPFVEGQVSKGQVTSPGYEHVVWEVVVETMQAPTLFAFSGHPGATDPDVDYSDEPTTRVEFRLRSNANGPLLEVYESGFTALTDPLRREQAWRSNEEGWTIQIANIKNYAEAVQRD